MRHSTWLLLAVAVLCPPAIAAQGIQNVTLRRAQQAFENLDYRQALSLGQASLRERLTGFERSEEHTSELQSQSNLVCRLLLEKKKASARPRKPCRQQRLQSQRPRIPGGRPAG